MATLTNTTTVKPARTDYPPHTAFLDALMSVLCIILVSGLFIDGWAHNHGIVDESFFTVYHAVMYASYALFGFVLIGLHYMNVNKGYTFWRALPQGYIISLIGVFIFGAGGFADMLWHIAFGIEEGIEALYSPSHLVLGVGYSVVIAGIIQSAWVRREPASGWGQLWWVVLTNACLLTIFTFFAQFMTFMGATDGIYGIPRDRDLWTTAIIGGYVLTASLQTGIVLFMMRRWVLPRGAVSAMFAFNGLLMGLMLILEMDNIGESALFISLFMIAPLLLAGIVADVLIWRLKATPHTPNTNRLIGTVTAFMIGASNLLAIYILGTLQDEFLWWEIHTWLGVPSLCAIAGIFLSMLVFPPQVPETALADPAEQSA